MRKIGVAILGLGVVGGGTYEVLSKNRQKMANAYGFDVEVLAVMDKNIERLEQLSIPNEIYAKSIMEVAMNPDIDIVVETIGGISIAKDFVIACLECGKTVVTANKELIAKNFLELNSLAKKNNAGLYYEASCVGGTPVIRTIMDSMQGNEIESIMGIVNGTTNYILSKMSDEGCSYDDALSQAQALGFAEFDPTSDVEGYDSMYKLSILTSLAFNGEVAIDNIKCEGITNIQKEDITYGKELGYTIKLLAIGKKTPKGIDVRVHPTFIKIKNPLAAVDGAYNGVKIVGDAVGEIMLYGKGAGALPTGSAIVSDILFASKFLDGHHYYPTMSKAFKSAKFSFINDYDCSYYIRLLVADKLGVLGQVGKWLSTEGVSVREIMQKDKNADGLNTILLTTHQTTENKLNKAIKKLANYQDICTVGAVIRVE